MPAGATVGLQVLAPPADAAVSISNLALGSSTATGGTGGATLGALTGLSCGPLAIICVPLGAMVGLATGAGAGAVVGLASALSSEPLAQLRKRLVRLGRSHDLRAELGSELARRAAARWSLGAPAPDYVLTVALRSLMLTSTRDAQLGLIADADVTLQRRAIAASDTSQTLTRKTYRFTSAASPLALWLDERGDLPDTLLSSASVQLAAQIVGEFSTP